MKRAAKVLAWIGFGLTLVVLGVMLARAASLFKPFAEGSAEAFWSGVYGVPVPDDQYHRVYYTPGEPYLYDPVEGYGIRLDMERYAAVSREEVLAEFPSVLDQLIAEPDGLTDDQVQALLGRELEDRQAALKDIACRRDAVAQSTERMHAFLDASYAAQAARMVKDMGSMTYAYDAADVYRRGGVVTRARHYWLTVAFEAVFLTALAGLFWWPVLSLRHRRWLPVVWGSLPLLFYLPYWLGYCRATFYWTDPYSWGGALYPTLLRPFEFLEALFGSWDETLLWATPRPLEFLNQPSMVSAERFVSEITEVVPAVGPGAPLLLSVALGGMIFAGRYVLRRRASRRPSM